MDFMELGKQVVVVLAAGMYFYYGNKISPRGSDKTKPIPLTLGDRFIIVIGLWAYAFWLLTTVIDLEALGFAP